MVTLVHKVLFWSVVEMGWIHFFLVFSLLLGTTSALREIPSSCTVQGGHQHQHQHINSTGIHLTLHHIRSPCSPVSPSHIPLSEAFHHDDLRVQSLTSRLTTTTTTTTTTHTSSLAGAALPETAVGVPLSPGLALGVGNFVTKIGLGTPSRDYIMVVDTGSSLTWLQCLPCKVSCHPQIGPFFDPASSSTYKTVPCTSPECTALQSATLNPSACSTSKTCIYEASYGDSSFSVGYLSRDTLSLGSSSSSLPSFVYGCGQDNNGLFGKTAGLLGLAKNKLSLLSQLAPKFGYAFSYCLPTASASSGYLSVGAAAATGGVVFTPLVSSSVDSTLYFVKLVGITVGRRALSVSAAEYTGTPTIIDSGTVITRLPPAVYSALSQAVTAALAGVARAPAFSILDTCFKGNSKTLPKAVPEVALVFQGGAVMRLETRNVFYDVSGYATCLAFARAGGVAIIGNRQQQTFKVIYDVANSKVGFAPGGCS